MTEKPNPNIQADLNVLLGNTALPYVLQAVGSVATTHEYVFDGVGADGLEVIMNRGRFVRQALKRAKTVGGTEERAVYDFLPGSIGRPGMPESQSARRGVETGRDYEDFDKKIRHLIQAGHSSFNKGNQPKPQLVRGLATRLRRWFFPPWDESLDRLEAMRPLLGRDLSVVVYGEPGYGDDYSEYTSFAERSVQPKADVWKNWGLKESSPTEDIKAAMQWRGIDALTWDTAHGEDFSEPSVLLKRLLDAGLVRRFHLSVGRTDQKKRLKDLGKDKFDAQTANARRAFIESPMRALETPEGKQLKMYIEAMEAQGHAGVVVLEEMPQRPVGKARQEQKSIIANIRLLRSAVLNKQT